MLKTWIKAAKAQARTSPKLRHQPAQANTQNSRAETKPGILCHKHRLQDTHPSLAKHPHLPAPSGSSLSLSHGVTSHCHTATAPGPAEITVTKSQHPHCPHNVPPTPLLSSPQRAQLPHSYLPTMSAARSFLQAPSRSPFMASPAPAPAQVWAGFGDEPLRPSPALPAAGPLFTKPGKVSSEGALCAMGELKA